MFSFGHCKLDFNHNIQNQQWQNIMYIKYLIVYNTKFILDKSNHSKQFVKFILSICNFDEHKKRPQYFIIIYTTHIIILEQY